MICKPVRDSWLGKLVNKHPVTYSYRLGIRVWASQK